MLLLALLAIQLDPLAPLPEEPKTAPLEAPVVRSRPRPRAPAVVPLAPSPLLEPVATSPLPLPGPLVVPRDWRAEFAAIRSGDWAGAAAGIAALPDSPLKPVAKAELYLAKGSPVVGVAELEALLAEAPDLPQAEQLTRLAASRGSLVTVPVPSRALVGLGSGPRRSRAKAVTGEPLADELRLGLDPLVKIDDAAAAETLMTASAALLSAEARAEAAQRVAWIYYGLGRDSDAVRIAEEGRIGATGDWAVAAAWVSGLASWRLNDCASAGARFKEVAGLIHETELAAAANYWAARAAQACRQPAAVAPLLRAAARSPESFYGLVARETLGMPTTLPPLKRADTRALESLPNVRRATALAEIGERTLAEEALRHQARIGRAADQRALVAIAEKLELTGAQYWLATNGQPGAAIEAAARYPRPRWTPLSGWRVDPALALGHILQESNFRASAVSPAGAIGLMQVMPGTAGDLARARGVALDRTALTDPPVNLDYGQAFIERMRGTAATRGQLPRVIAAYNAGPLPVDRWNAIPDKGDPLLWMESIPYWETRYYVPAVMRNMWVYQGLSGAPQPTLHAIAEHKWPAFPAKAELSDAGGSASQLR